MTFLILVPTLIQALVTPSFLAATAPAPAADIEHWLDRLVSRVARSREYAAMEVGDRTERRQIDADHLDTPRSIIEVVVGVDERLGRT